MTATETQLNKRLMALRKARLQFRECMVAPLQKARFKPSPMATAQVVWDLPLEAAAAGYRVTTFRRDSGWTIQLQRQIDSDSQIEATGTARSLLAALTRLIADVNLQIDQMESDTRAELAAMKQAVSAA